MSYQLDIQSIFEKFYEDNVPNLNVTYHLSDFDDKIIHELVALYENKYASDGEYSLEEFLSMQLLSRVKSPLYQLDRLIVNMDEYHRILNWYLGEEFNNHLEHYVSANFEEALNTFKEIQPLPTFNFSKLENYL